MSRYKLNGTELAQNPSSFEPIEGGQPVVEYVDLVSRGRMRIAHEPSGADEDYRQKKRKWRAVWSLAPIALVENLELKCAFQESFTWNAQDYDATSAKQAPTSNPSGDDKVFYGPERPVLSDSTFKVFVNDVQKTTGFSSNPALCQITFDTVQAGTVELEYTWQPTFKIDVFTKRRQPRVMGRFDCEATFVEV